MAVPGRTPLSGRRKREAAARRPARPSVAYRRLVVPLHAGAESEQAMAIACALAAEHGALVTAVAVIEVAAELPLDAHMVEEETQARPLVSEAQAIGDRYGVSVATRIVRARAVGAAIVEEAWSAEAEIIVLGAPRKKSWSGHAPAFGKTVHFVLKHAPCRVMVAAPAASG